MSDDIDLRGEGIDRKETVYFTNKTADQFRAEMTVEEWGLGCGLMRDRDTKTLAAAIVIYGRKAIVTIEQARIFATELLKLCDAADAGEVPE